MLRVQHDLCLLGGWGLRGQEKGNFASFTCWTSSYYVCGGVWIGVVESVRHPEVKNGNSLMNGKTSNRTWQVKIGGKIYINVVLSAIIVCFLQRKFGLSEARLRYRPGYDWFHMIFRGFEIDLVCLMQSGMSLALLWNQSSTFPQKNQLFLVGPK